MKRKKKNFLIIGLGRFGLSVLKRLSAINDNIIAIDIDENRVNLASEYVQNCFICDCTKKRTLIDLGIENIDKVIVAIGNNLQASILVTMNLKELGVKNIIVRVDEDDYIDVMKRLGASEVIIPEEDSADNLAIRLMSDSFLDYYNINDEYGIVKLSSPSSFISKSLIEIDARNKFNVNIIGIIRNDIFFMPKGNDNINGNDIILVLGKNSDINKFNEYLSGK